MPLGASRASHGMVVLRCWIPDRVAAVHRNFVSTRALGLVPFRASSFPGAYAGGVTPVPIPNTEVKSSRADGTAGETLWESRTPPGLSLGAPLID